MEYTGMKKEQVIEKLRSCGLVAVVRAKNAELNGKNSWWQVKDGNCAHSANAAWNGKPDSFAANENGLWAIVNGEVAFDVTGEYSYGTYYSVSGEDSIYVSYIYQVENGLVTSMQATVLDR